MHRRTTFALAAVLALTVPAAEAIPFLTPSVTIEYDHTAQFAHRTYSWGVLEMAAPTYEPAVHAAVDKGLRQRGWQLVPSGGSATVFVLGDVRGEDQVKAFYAAKGGGFKQDWGPEGLGAGWKPYYGNATINALSLPQNNLMIDIFDTASHQLIFRGVTEDDLSRTEKKNTKRLEKYIKQVFKEFPKK